MNSSPQHPWQRLVAAARRAPADDRPVQAPPAFATRVAALGLSRVEPPLSALLARFAGRALGVAALVMLVSVVATVKPVMTALQTAEAVAVVDPSTDWLELS